MAFSEPGLYDVPAGKLAAIVTSLEMRNRPQIRPAAEPETVLLKHWQSVEPSAYRSLYRRVGEPWLWFSRLRMTDNELSAIINDKNVDVFAVEFGGAPEGLLELDYRDPGTCEIAFFGLSKKVIGQGVGAWLMSEALRLAWSRPINRLWVHTCTLDSPAALGFYCRFGFVPFRQQIEIIDDPRLDGTLSQDAGTNIPPLSA